MAHQEWSAEVEERETNEDVEWRTSTIPNRMKQHKLQNVRLTDEKSTELSLNRGDRRGRPNELEDWDVKTLA